MNIQVTLRIERRMALDEEEAGSSPAESPQVLSSTLSSLCFYLVQCMLMGGNLPFGSFLYISQLEQTSLYGFFCTWPLLGTVMGYALNKYL